MKTLILLTMSTLFLLGCAVKVQQEQLPITETGFPTLNISSTVSPVPLSSPVNKKTKLFLTATPVAITTSFPNVVFHFGATPELGQVGGISGIFYREDGPDKICAQNYRVFRFYNDGLVIHSPVCDDNPIGGFGNDVWPDMSAWFSRENSDKATPQGIYRVAENEIWFTVIAEYPSHMVIIDYFGTFSAKQLVLNSFSHPLGYPISVGETTGKYIWLDVANDP